MGWYNIIFLFYNIRRFVRFTPNTFLILNNDNTSPVNIIKVIFLPGSRIFIRNLKLKNNMSKNKLNLTLPPGVADNQQPVSPSAPLSAASDTG